MTDDGQITPRLRNEKPEDSDLLRSFAESGSQDAFAKLVRRRIDFVYSVALRQTGGDRHRAEDATQAVFTDLAHKVRTLATRPVLVGWLYHSARFAAGGLVRREQRRQAREQEAHTMQTVLAESTHDAAWEQVRPVLDEALNEIGERDRDAILMRYFDGRSFPEIGLRLRLTENAARMRVERALEQLGGALRKRGITSTASALAAVVGQQLTATTPVGLATTVTSAALAQAAIGVGALVVAYKALTARAKDSAQTAAERESAAAAAKFKLAEIQAKQREIQAFIAAARAADPQANVVGMNSQYRSTEWVKREVEARKAWRAAANAATPGAVNEPERFSVSLPNSDFHTAVSLFEKISGSRIGRDPSLAAVTGTFTVKTDRSTKEETIATLQAALRERFNIVFEPMPDGALLAKLGGPR